MGAFGIFVLVLTLLYILYYSGMIWYDLFGNKLKKSDTVQVITPEGSDSSTFIEEEGVKVEETADGGFSINDGDEYSEQYSSQPSEDLSEPFLSKEESDEINITRLQERLEEVQSQLQSTDILYDSEDIEESNEAIENIVAANLDKVSQSVSI